MPHDFKCNHKRCDMKFRGPRVETFWPQQYIGYSDFKMYDWILSGVWKVGPRFARRRWQLCPACSEKMMVQWDRSTAEDLRIMEVTDLWLIAEDNLRSNTRRLRLPSS